MIITALIGTVIGALFGSAGYFLKTFLKTRSEAKKTTRKVLYWLLEIHHAIETLRLDPTDLTQEYLQYFRNKMMEHGIPCEGELPPQLKNLIIEHLKNVIDSARTGLDERFLDPYEKALLELAQVDPVLAYQLRGKEKLTAFVQLANQYSYDFSELVRSEVSTDHSRESTVSLADRAKKDAIDLLVQELEQDILKVARISGGKDLKQCRSLLAETYPDMQYDFSKLDPLLEEFSMFDGTPHK
jgi:hypothetical protein